MQGSLIGKKPFLKSRIDFEIIIEIVFYIFNEFNLTLSCTPVRLVSGCVLSI